MGEMRRLFFIVSIVSTVQLSAQEVGSFTDSRDGKTYRTVTYVHNINGVDINRTWMGENLNFKTKNSYCYRDEFAYCEKYGRLYNYKEAIEACPVGWHVPTIKEWRELINHYGGVHKAGVALFEGGESKLDLQYGGFGEPGHRFTDITISGNWWDSEKKSETTAGIITLEEGTSEIFHEVIGEHHKLSARCFKLDEN